MKLFLARHARAGTFAGTPDHERALCAAGLREARAAGEWLAQRGARPVVALCSSALRAQQTLELLAGPAGGSTEPRVSRELYLATAEQLLDEIQGVEEGPQELLVVGHNPGIGELAVWLSGSGDGALQQQLGRGFPAGAIAELASTAGDWHSLEPGAARLRAFYMPDA